MSGWLRVCGRGNPLFPGPNTDSCTRRRLWASCILHEHAGSVVYLLGEVDKPGSYTINKPISVLQALALAGSHTADAELDKEAQAHHLDQDFFSVNRDAGRLLFEGVLRMVKLLGLEDTKIDSIVASIPTRQLYEDNVGRFLEHFGLSKDGLKFRARNTGYCGGASLLLHFDEMVRSNEIKPGHTVLVHSVESSKWMTAGFAVRW